MATVKLPDASTLTPDQLIDRWTKWLKTTEQEAFSLYKSRYTWENIQRMYASNTALQRNGGHVFNWMHRNFWTEHVMAIRREVESGGGFLTLINFLHEVEDYAEKVLTRKRRAMRSHPPSGVGA